MKHAAICLLLLLLVAPLAPAQDTATNTAAAQTYAMPDFQAEALDGRQVDTKALHGQVVLLDLWAVWCAPCIQSAPALDRMYRDLRDEGLEMVGIAVQSGTAEKVKAAAAKLGMTYPVILWNTDLAKKIKGIEAVPTYILINQDWQVEKIFVGATAPAVLRDSVERVLARKPKNSSE
jgi:thiol-disulfide isomerase/thioredoxin